MIRFLPLHNMDSMTNCDSRSSKSRSSAILEERATVKKISEAQVSIQCLYDYLDAVKIDRQLQLHVESDCSSLDERAD